MYLHYTQYIYVSIYKLETITLLYKYKELKMLKYTTIQYNIREL